MNPVMTGDVANRRKWRAAEIPAANGQGNARAVARIAGVLARGGESEGVRLLSEDTLSEALEEQSYGQDLVLGVPIRFGLGFGLRSAEVPIGQSDKVLFWGGWGGSLVVMDLEAKLGFSYVMNRMGEGTLGDIRGISILAGIYAGLGVLKRRHAMAALVAGLAMAAAGCAAGGSSRGGADPAGLVPKDFDGCVQGGGRLDHAATVCLLQINERVAPTAFAYCRSQRGELRAVGSVSGLRVGNDRGNVCTLTYHREEEPQP